MQPKRRSITRGQVGAVALILGLVIGGSAMATAQSEAVQFTGCLHKGKLTDVAVGTSPDGGTCKHGEQITWNQAGVPGPPGAQGERGEQGIQGEPGEPGAPGDTVPATRWWEDADGDGAGDFYAFLDSAAQPPGHVANNNDCDDGNASVRPGALDDGSLGVPDADCDGVVGEGVLLTWYRDFDGDGFGDGFVATPVERRRSLGALAGYVLNFADCDDGDPSATPYTIGCGDGVTRDLDGDGHDAIARGGDDCDDFDALRYPGAAEINDAFGHDEDCELTTDGGFMPYDPGYLDPRIPTPDPFYGEQSPLQQAR